MKHSVENQRDATIALFKSSLNWWEQHRPVDWDLRQHLSNPAINTAGAAETQLSEAVANAIKNGVL